MIQRSHLLQKAVLPNCIEVVGLDVDGYICGGCRVFLFCFVSLAADCSVLCFPSTVVLRNRFLLPTHLILAFKALQMSVNQRKFAFG